MLEVIIPAFTVFFVAIDPLGVAPIFAGLTAGSDMAYRRRMAFKAVITVTIVLFLFAILGKAFLGSLGITLDAFRVAGGLLLLLIAIDMVFEKRTQRRTQRADQFQADHKDFEDISIFPLAIPMIAGPGAITAVMLMVSNYHGDAAAQAIVLGTLLFILVLTFFILIGASYLMKFLGEAITAAFTRILGVVLAALSVQYIFDGARALLA